MVLKSQFQRLHEIHTRVMKIYYKCFIKMNYYYYLLFRIWFAINEIGNSQIKPTDITTCLLSSILSDDSAKGELFNGFPT